LPSELTGNSTLNVTTANLTISDSFSGHGFELTKTGSGVVTLRGMQDYATLNANGGTTNLDAVLGNGDSTINAGAVLKISSNQQLAALNIGAGGIVTLLGQPAMDASETNVLVGNSTVAVPEPGTLALLFLGASLLGRWRKAG